MSTVTIETTQNEVTIETTQNEVTIETTQNEVTIETTQNEVVLELTGGGTLLPGSIVSGLNAANEPSATNPFATMDDVLAYALMMGA